MWRELFIHLNIYGLRSVELVLVTSKYSRLMEVDIAQLVETEVSHYFITPLKIKVYDILVFVDNLVNVHQVANFKHVLLNVNRAVEVSSVNQFDGVLQLEQLPSEPNK